PRGSRRRITHGKRSFLRSTISRGRFIDAARASGLGHREHRRRGRAGGFDRHAQRGDRGRRLACAHRSRHAVRARRSSQRRRIRAPLARSTRTRRIARRRAGVVLMHWLPLLGVAVVVAGFALRFNPVPVVVLAGVVSGLCAGKSIGEILALLGNSFVSERALLLFALTLPAIGVLERAGLREHARNWIASLRSLTLPRLLIAYLGLRQTLSMLGLTNVAGHAQTVRPLL